MGQKNEEEIGGSIDTKMEEGEMGKEKSFTVERKRRKLGKEKFTSDRQYKRHRKRKGRLRDMSDTDEQKMLV